MTERCVVVVGAGVAGLAAAAAIRRRDPATDVLVLEERARVGGLVETEQTPDSFLVEHGADCLVTTKPRGLAAARDGGLEDMIVEGSGARRTYVATRDGLVPMPQLFAGVSPNAVFSLLQTPLLTFAGKVRVALEPFVHSTRAAGDESVRDFVTRRFGAELAAAVIEPLIGGVHGDDTSRLSVDACLPRLRELEREHGSVTRGVQRAIRARRRSGRAGEPLLPPAVSFRHGMASLPAALARQLGDRLALGVAVRRVTRGRGGGFALATARGLIQCDGVVLAAPAWQAAAIVDGVSADLAADLATLGHRALDCVTFAWPRHDVPHALDATGWVRAAGDRRGTVACTWSSRKWPGRAPEGFVLLRSVLSVPDASDAELLETARADLRDLIGVATPPSLIRMRRLPRATPICEVGHLSWVERVARQAASIGAFALAGNAHGGIGVPDCVASGERAADAVLDALAS